MDVLKLATFTGAPPNISDAYTINGQPGDLYRCSKKASTEQLHKSHKPKTWNMQNKDTGILWQQMQHEDKTIREATDQKNHKLTTTLTYI
ncbi:laccase-3 [Tripterygium wilfordii]|uniref:Laccase-3 n=1 Tax=Tripterygium wilfordii TaxID=458696 RepID=A0A7J7DDT6_TRIWF|nr:laccase-3 [Tripterygium wilfordii]